MSTTVARSNLDPSVSSTPRGYPRWYRDDPGRPHQDAAAWLNHWIHSQTVKPVPFSTEPPPVEDQLELGLSGLTVPRLAPVTVPKLE